VHAEVFAQDMPIITIETLLPAPPERCFDASRDLDLHVKSMTGTSEKAVAGRTSGLIEMGEQVTWEGRHFGIRQRFTSKITAFDRPRYFQDSMLKGAFHSFVHDHYFEATAGGTKMTDVLTFASPLGFLGAIADRLILAAYLRRMLTARNEVIKAAVATP
jgi:ligand-binding SRPBCC domain-containing protein